MIMYLYKKIAITDRELFFKAYREKFKTEKENYIKEAYMEHLLKLTEKVDLMILREKNLDMEEYKNLVQNLFAVLENRENLVLHTHIKTAFQLDFKKIHLPFPVFCKNLSLLHLFELTGVSVHSLEEARFAEKHGADYIIAGHIFQTQCKKDLKPKGLDFLENICENIKIPVYALGGITEENELDTIKAGALGACRMSDYMKDTIS